MHLTCAGSWVHIWTIARNTSEELTLKSSHLLSAARGKKELPPPFTSRKGEGLFTLSLALHALPKARGSREIQ